MKKPEQDLTKQVCDTIRTEGLAIHQCADQSVDKAAAAQA